MYTITKRQSVLVTSPDLSWVLSNLAANIERETDCISLVGTDENIAAIEKKDELTDSDTTIALGDGNFKEKVSNIAKNTCLSSTEVIYHAEDFNYLTNEEASEAYKEVQAKNPNLPLNYQTFKKNVKSRRAQSKIAKIGDLLDLSPEKIRNVFQLKRQN